MLYTLYTRICRRISLPRPVSSKILPIPSFPPLVIVSVMKYQQSLGGPNRPRLKEPSFRPSVRPDRSFDEYTSRYAPTRLRITFAPRTGRAVDPHDAPGRTIGIFHARVYPFGKKRRLIICHRARRRDELSKQNKTARRQRSEARISLKLYVSATRRGDIGSSATAAADTYTA